MMLLDIMIEVSAPRFDFWEFENSIIPIKNYIAWFIIGSIAHYLYRQINSKTNKKVIYSYICCYHYFLFHFFNFLMQKYDYIITGSGASGLMLAYRMAKDSFFDTASILIIDKEKKTSNDRTWCFWENGKGEWDDLVHKSWR